MDLSTWGLESNLLDSIAQWTFRLGGAVVFLVLAWWVGGRARHWSRTFLEKAKLDQTLVKFASNVLRWAILSASFIACLGLLGVNTGSYAAILGAAGLAIGLAFQNSLSNLAAGIMLLIFRPFKVGDALTVGDLSGIVDETDIMLTSINGFDGKRYIIPNHQLFTQKIANLSHYPYRRVEVILHIPYTNAQDTELTREVLSEVASSHSDPPQGSRNSVNLIDIKFGIAYWRVRIWHKFDRVSDERDGLLSDAHAKLAVANIQTQFAPNISLSIPN